MKILHFNQNFGFFGGVEQYIFDVCKGLQTLGHQNIIAYHYQTPLEVEKFASVFSGKYRLPPLDKYNRQKEMELLNSLRGIIKKETPHIAFVHKVDSPVAVQFIASNVPTVRMVHDHALCCLREHKIFYFSGLICNRRVGLGCILCGGFLGRRGKGRIIPKYNSLSRKLKELEVNRRLNKIIVASNYMKEELVQNGFREDKIAVIPLFTEIPHLDESNTTSDESNLILFVGQIERGKGVGLLLKALVHLKSPFQAIIIGQGKILEKMKALCLKLGLQDRVKFLGWIPHEQLGDYYRRSSVVVMPSTWAEPFGLVGVEAMAHAKPVVAFRVGGIPDWLEDGKTGFLVDDLDPKKLAKKIELLLQDEILAKELGMYGRKSVVAKFNAKVHIGQLIDIFEEVIKKS